MSSNNYFSRFAVTLLLALAVPIGALAQQPTTERQYLSGHGPKDAVPWEFSVTGGRRAGEHTTIPVPSNWEQHGFGVYNYGLAPVPRSSEHGLYTLRFAVPESWRGRRVCIVFDGVMTDAAVKVNDVVAGPTHQGAFYRFRYDITSLIKFSNEQNLLEVDVAKASTNAATDLAERGGDYWVFGGIFRPVWLESSPMQAIKHVAIDARADGLFAADLTLEPVSEGSEVEAQIFASDGKPAGTAFKNTIPAGGTGRLRITSTLEAPKLWTAETPNLYTVKLTLRKGDEVLHVTSQRFGFRTFEVRAGQGLFLNGQRILLKGVNRHSFRPETARALDTADCYADVRLIRSMNMNAVRMSHYPPDEAFLEACDELGLYVLDEFSGWHHAYDTEVGRKLVREMVERDVNHPSILFWDNGNEGGWNRELDGEFSLYDPQKRRLILPSDTHDDLDTKHYPPFDELAKKLSGPNLVMPTEFMHALYDGGGGAGLEDYWTAITQSPVGAGGFIWALFDEGVVRTDQGGRIDVFASYAPDGLVGPHLEKEGSYYTIRDIWCPVQIAAPNLAAKFSGKLAVSNRYDFTSLAQCHFAWELVRYRGASDDGPDTMTIAEGKAAAPDIAPHGSGEIELQLPPSWRDADALRLTASDRNHEELWTWTWPTPALTQRVMTSSKAPSDAAPKVVLAANEVRLEGGGVTAAFDATTGLLKAIHRHGQLLKLSDGPRLAFARPESADAPEWLSFAGDERDAETQRLVQPRTANKISIDLAYAKSDSWAGLKLEISPDGISWKTIFDGLRRKVDGNVYNFPPQSVVAVRLSNVRRADGERMPVKLLQLSYSAARFPPLQQQPALISHGTELDARTGETKAWFESHGTAGLQRVRWSLGGDGILRLNYAYELSGDFIYHGITFSCPEESVRSLRWMGQGPYRVWQNRLRGTALGVYEMVRNNIQPGESWTFPEFQGYFAGLRWARVEMDDGSFIVKSASPEVYLRIGTPRINHQMTTVDFPAGDISFMHAIPAMGSKFIAPDASGPRGRPAKASGTYSGSLVFEFGGKHQ